MGFLGLVVIAVAIWLKEGVYGYLSERDESGT
jgi:hypothetical protein